MNSNFTSRCKQSVLALLIMLFTGPASSDEPVFLNNAVTVDDFLPVGKHINASDTAGLGASSIDEALQISIAIDSQSNVYSAYLSAIDGKAYVTKLVDGQWTSAAMVDIDSDGSTVGDVSEKQLLATSQTNDYINSNRSLAMAISANDEVFVAFSTIDNTVVVKKLNIDEFGQTTFWETLPVIESDNVSLVQLSIDSEGSPIMLYGGEDSGDTENVAKLTLVKFVEKTWVALGNSGDLARESTHTTARIGVIAASFAISPINEIYLAFESAEEGLNSNEIYVQKLVEDTWVTVGSRGIVDEVGNIRALDLTISDIGVPYLASDSSSHGLAVSKFEGENIESDWVSLGQKINVPYQDRGSKTPVNYLDINVNKAGVPFVAYQDPNSTSERIRILNLQQITVDNEQVDSWQQLNIDENSLSQSDSTKHSQPYTDITFDRNDRPYVTYQDGGSEHNLTSRVIRSKLMNNPEGMIFSVLEGTLDAGQFTLESDEAVSLSLSGQDAVLFSVEALVEHKLQLLTAADFRTPIYTLNVTATNENNESTNILPIQVNFEADPELEPAREFAFEIFGCELDCQFTIAEGNSVPSIFVMSKISHVELQGDLPDGIEFNLTDPSAGFTGKTTYNASGEYPLTLIAYPNDAAVEQNPISLELVIIVNNVPMEVTNADYSLVLNENEEYSNTPVGVAVERYSIDALPIWAEGFDESAGVIKGMPDYTQAGVYSGSVIAYGFDSEVEEFPFIIEVQQVDLELRGGDEQDLSVVENSTLTFIPDVTAAQHFTIHDEPDWVTFDTITGELVGKPDFTQEGEHSLTIIAYGYDNEPSQKTTLIIRVEHKNSPPTSNVPDQHVESGNSIFINVMEHVSDLDSARYGDSVFFVLGEDTYSHDGFGVLEQVRDGFVYTPAQTDKDTVTVNFTITDDSVDGATTSKESFNINVKTAEKTTFEQTSSGGSIGGIGLFLVSFLFGFRKFKGRT